MINAITVPTYCKPKFSLENSGKCAIFNRKAGRKRTELAKFAKRSSNKCEVRMRSENKQKCEFTLWEHFSCSKKCAYSLKMRLKIQVHIKTLQNEK